MVYQWRIVFYGRQCSCAYPLSDTLSVSVRCQFEEEDVRHTLLDDVLTTLTTDMPTASKTSSRDLAGILKNLRKVEQAVQGGKRKQLYI